MSEVNRDRIEQLRQDVIDGAGLSLEECGELLTAYDVLRNRVRERDDQFHTISRVFGGKDARHVEGDGERTVAAMVAQEVAKLKAELAARPAGEPACIGEVVRTTDGTVIVKHCGLQYDWRDAIDIIHHRVLPGSRATLFLGPPITPPQPLPEPVYTSDYHVCYEANGLAAVAVKGTNDTADNRWYWRAVADNWVWSDVMTREAACNAAAEWVAGAATAKGA